MKTGASAFVDKNGGVVGKFHALYRNAIRSDFVKKVAETFSTQILLFAIGLIASVIVTRILGPEGRGFYALAGTVGATGVQFCNLGLHSSSTYYVAKDRSLLPDLTGNSLFVSFGLGGLCAILVWIVFYLKPQWAPLHGNLLLLALAWIPFGLASLLLQNLLLGIHEVRAYNTVQLMTQIISIGLVGVVIILGMVTVINVFIAGFIAFLVGLCWALWKITKFLKRFPALNFILLKKNLSYGVKAYLACLFSFLVFRMDLLMVQYILGPKQAGYYSIAVSIANMLLMFPVTVGTILFPKLSTPQDEAERWAFTNKTALHVGGIMICACVFMLFFGRYLIVLMYGKAFEPAYGPLVFLLIGILLWSIESIYRKVLNTDAEKGFRIEVVYIWMLVFPVNIILNYFFIKWYGIKGAAMTSAFSLLLVFIFIMTFAAKEQKRKLAQGGNE